MNKYSIAVLAGDGIGQEITPLCTSLLTDVCQQVGGIKLEFAHLDAGAACYRRWGEALPEETMAAVKKADAILLGAMGLPDVRYPDGTEISPQLDFRVLLELYAGVRPVKTFNSLPLPLHNRDQRDIDFVLIRESTEGLFASHGKGVVTNDHTATDTMVITRPTCERLFDFAFNLAQQRGDQGHQARVTCVDKANVFTSMAFFRKIFDERSARYPNVEAHRMYVDAAALNLVKQPWTFEVIVTENMFGDILSDLGAGLMGGMGMAPSGDIGDAHGVFQPCHGSAPDIAGLGRANPTAMFLSGSMMLDWLAQQHQDPQAATAGRHLADAVTQAFTQYSLIPMEMGGGADTSAITRAVKESLETLTAKTQSL